MYTFDVLSDYDFEQLVRDLLQKRLGVQLESFAPGPDSGIDLRFFAGPTQITIVQCKHYARSGFPKLLSAMKKEVSKVAELKPKRYLLATSVPLTPANKDDLLELIAPYCISPHDIYGRDELNGLLRDFPDVERSHVKLWLSTSTVLQQVANTGIFLRSERTIEGIKRRIALFVDNPSFSLASQILEASHYCVITGIPGIGKSTLARLLMVRYASEGFQPLVVRSSKEIEDTLNASQRQIYLYDDFLGETRLQRASTRDDKALLELVAFLQESSNTRLLLVTREYIMNQLQHESESWGRAKVGMAKCVVDLKQFTGRIKAQILYNHLYFCNSKLPTAYRDYLLYESVYMPIVQHPNFSPRTIEAMTQTVGFDRTWTPAIYARKFLEALDNPSDLWMRAFRFHLERNAQNLLTCLATFPGTVVASELEGTFHTYHTRQSRIHNFPTSSSDFRDALQQLQGSFIELDGKIIKFHNPSIRDFMTEYLRHEDSVLECLVESAVTTDQLMHLWFLSNHHFSDNISLVFLNRLVTLSQDRSYQLFPRCDEFRMILDLWIRFPMHQAKQHMTFLTKKFLKNPARYGGDIECLWTILEYVSQSKVPMVSPGGRFHRLILKSALDVGEFDLWSVRDWNFVYKILLRHRPLVSQNKFESIRSLFQGFVETAETLIQMRESVESMWLELDNIERIASFFGVDFDAERDAIAGWIARYELELGQEDSSFEEESLEDDETEDIRSVFDTWPEEDSH